MTSRFYSATLARATAALVFLLAAAARPAQAQDAGRTGRIVGRIVDASSGVGLSDVGVQVVGTTLGTQSGIDGRFRISNIPAGTVTLQARRIGFAAKTVTGILLDPGQTLEQNIALAASAVTLSAQVVTAAAERGTVSEALDRQRTATGIVNAITSEQIARSPDSDAAQAVQRVSGVTVQDGRYVFVRGLGERYTTTSLNGSRMPSPEPERKVVPLDLFPSGLLQSVTTTKTFSPDQPGDFSGAQVDIRTREFPAQRQFTYATTIGYNSAAAGSDAPAAPRAGGEWAALATGGDRDLPGALRSAGNLGGIASPAEKNALINSLRNVWRVEEGGAPVNSSFSASVGGNDPVLGQRIGYIASGTYSLNREVRTDEVRALGRFSNTGEAPLVYNRFVGETGRASVLWGGMLNLSTLLGRSTRLSLNNTYNRTADNDARLERGTLETEGDALIQRLDYVERSVRTNQLAGEHELGRHRVDWAYTNSGVSRDQPDRSEFVQQVDADPTTGDSRLLWLASGGEGSVRTFATLAERSDEGRLNYQLQLPLLGRAQAIKLGALYRTADRTADTRAYGLFSNLISEEERALAPEEIFGGRFTTPDSSRLDVRALGQGGYYEARDRLAAGYAMTDVAVTERLHLIGGARVEQSEVRVDAVSTLGDASRSDRRFTDVLPSLALNFQLTQLQNVRVSGSRTLARPEYRELADVTTRDVIGGLFLRGNPNLVRTQVTNADVRWEWYPHPGEILSVAAFAKRFEDPIERVFQAQTSGTSVIYFANAESAENYGLELEARKGLGFLGGALAPFTGFVNLTLVRSEVKLGSSQAASTNANRRMVGQAPYVVNTGLTWTSASGAASATALYNRVGERITNAGEQPAPDVIEQSRDVVDLSVRFPLFASLSGRFDVRNVLDAEYRIEQGPLLREGYRTGRVFQAGVSWRP